MFQLKPRNLSLDSLLYTLYIHVTRKTFLFGFKLSIISCFLSVYSFVWVCMAIKRGYPLVWNFLIYVAQERMFILHIYFPIYHTLIIVMHSPSKKCLDLCSTLWYEIFGTVCKVTNSCSFIMYQILYLGPHIYWGIVGFIRWITQVWCVLKIVYI